jgi:phospholipid/cholesterol/gamma-HCH transport system permease protein
MLESIDHIGKLFFNLLRTFVQMLIFVYLSFRSIVTLKKPQLKSILFIFISQIYFTGVQALALMTFIALATGSVIVLQSNAQLTLVGSQEMMGNVLVVTIIRELGPLLTALIVIARSGTAVSTELGSMQVNKEIEALRVMSIEPMGYVVFPRILGGVVSLVCLAFYFNVIALVGGYLVCNILGHLSFSYYIEALSAAITAEDFTVNILKNGLSGFIIFSISTFYGMNVNGAPHEVPKATTDAVVTSIMTVVAFNLSVSVFLLARTFN